jgi:isocitrate lyase
MGVPTLLVARTDAESAKLITSDVDERDLPFLVAGERTSEGFYRLTDGTSFERCVARGLAYAPYADLIWMETSTPDLEQARTFAEAIRREHPRQDAGLQLLAFELQLEEPTSTTRRSRASSASSARWATPSSSSPWRASIALNHGDVRRSPAATRSARHGRLFRAAGRRVRRREAYGYTATRHQREVGTGYFDRIATALNPDSETLALVGSTETAQFQH